MTKKGFGFGERFKRDLEESAPRPPAEKPAEAPAIPIVIYAPFRCPRCGARYPDHRGSGRQKLPLHYLTCQKCGTEYHAQEADHRTVAEVAKRLHSR